MDLEKTVEYLKGMAILGDHVSVWPSPTETLLSSQKLETNRMLCSCATSLGFRHPMVAPLEDGDVDAVFDSIMRGDRDAVLKRDHSGGQNTLSRNIPQMPRRLSTGSAGRRSCTGMSQTTHSPDQCGLSSHTSLISSAWVK